MFFLWIGMQAVAFFLLLLVFRIYQRRSGDDLWKALASEIEELEEVELAAWDLEFESDPHRSCRKTRRLDLMKRFATTTAILAALVLWHVFVAAAPLDAATDVVQPAEAVPPDAVTAAAPVVEDGDEFVTIPVELSGGAAMVGIDELPPAVVVDEPDDGVVKVVPSVEPDPSGDVATEPVDGGAVVVAEEVPVDDAIPDPDSDAEVKEVLEGANFLIQAIKDKDAVAITLGVFLILFALFRIPPIRKTLTQWIPPNWYRAIPVVLAVVVGILTPILAGGDAVDAVMKGLISGGGIVAIYAALVKATAKKTESDA